MEEITKKAIEQAKNSKIPKEVENILEVMDNEMCTSRLGSLAKEVNASNKLSDKKFYILQAALIYAKNKIESCD